MTHHPKTSLPWIEELPKDWSSIRIKYCLHDGREGSRIGPFGSSLKLDEMVKEGYKVYGQENIIANDFCAGQRFISQEKFDEMKSYSVSPGDILITMMGTVGQCRIVPDYIQPGLIDSHLLRLRVKSNLVSPRYFDLVVGQSDISKKQAEILSKGSIMSGLNSSIVRDMLIPLPPLEVQKAIASFLDHKTAAITTLIAKKQRLIQLLEEKRTALINQVVTKGLNPNAPMKDSGISWIGRVPKHWEVLHLKRVIALSDYGISDQLEPIGTYPVLRMGNLQNEQIVMDDIKYVDEVDPQLILEPNDILFNRTNSRDLVGKVALFRGNFDAEVTYASYLVRFRTNELAEPEYLVLFLGRKDVQQIARAMALPAIGQVNLNPNRYGYLRICLPPRSEQIEIVAWLRNRLSDLQKLINKNRHQIEKLQEYRQSLITSAVTGKLNIMQKNT